MYTNPQPNWHSSSAVRVVYLKTSDTGYGCCVVKHRPYLPHGQWPGDMDSGRVYDELSVGISNMA